MQTVEGSVSQQAMAIFEGAVRYAPEVLIDALVRESGDTPETARHKLAEVQKFMAMCAAVPERKFAVSKVLDETWHTFILHTYMYSQFCEEYIGSFVHHRPTAQPETAMDIATKETLTEVFGPLDRRFWPVVKNSAADCDSGTCSGYCSCGCNAN